MAEGGTPRLQFRFARVDASVRRDLIYPSALDGVPLGGLLYQPVDGEPDVVVLAMHPRGDFTRHYLAPGLVGAGYAFAGVNSRYLNNDSDALHERLLLDVGGVIAELRDRGFRKVILAGNSGGGSLFAYYLEQALRDPGERFEGAPSGDRVRLRHLDLPLADGLALLAAHLGEGLFLLDRLDPAMIDEANPSAVNPRLDMYNPENGYRPMEKGPSHYSADFIAEYRAAQRARCERLDRQAMGWCEDADYHRARMRTGAAGAPLPGEERDRALRRGLQRRYLVIYRTLADPRYLDPTLDPSPRELGSIFAYGGRDPIYGNYGEGLARCMSARGWLSTWSGLESRAALPRSLPGVTVPTQVIYADGDTDIYPSEARRAFEAAGASDKVLCELKGADHYLNPTGPEAAKLADPVERMQNEYLLPWLRERWPV